MLQEMAQLMNCSYDTPEITKTTGTGKIFISFQTESFGVESVGKISSADSHQELHWRRIKCACMCEPMAGRGAKIRSSSSSGFVKSLGRQQHKGVQQSVFYLLQMQVSWECFMRWATHKHGGGGKEGEREMLLGVNKSPLTYGDSMNEQSPQ